jgi:signal transduction histidine kinase
VNVVNVPIYRGRDNRRQKNLATILGAGMIYLGGGVTNNLAADDCASRPRSSRCAMQRRTASSSRPSARRRRASARPRATCAATLRRSRLGWLAGTVIDTAFDPQNDTALRRLMSLPDVTLGIGIPPKTALVIAATEQRRSSAKARSRLSGNRSWMRHGTHRCTFAHWSAAAAAFGGARTSKAAVELQPAAAFWGCCIETGVTQEELVRFFSVLSHDLKSPIFAVDGFSDLLLSDYLDKLDEEGQDFLRRIRSSAQYMKRVLDEMSHMVKLLARPTHASRRRCARVVEEVILKYNFQIEEGGVRVDLPTDLPVVNVDPEKMREAIGALLANALFFTDRPKGERQIAIDCMQRRRTARASACATTASASIRATSIRSSSSAA